jgi:PKD repeat protein
VSNPGIERSVQARLSLLGVPADLVDVIPAPEIYQVDSLQTGTFRPVPAGVQVHFSNYLCSVGFNAIRDGVSGFVTASHCTAHQGGVEGTLYYQPLSSVAQTPIGTEIADPNYSKGGGCPAGRVCRWSDSAFVRYDNGVSGELGKIAATSGFNNGSLEVSSRFTITSENSASTGTMVNKVGRTTGWTRAPVTADCANVGVSGTNIVQRCQDIVTSTGPVIVLGGDSGSGVFTLDAANNASLVGILWGGSSDGKTMVYSPLSNIEMSAELGALTTFGSGPANNPPAASFTFDCTGLTCDFTSTSSDGDGTIVTYAWNFGDRTASTAANPVHTYAASGIYTVTLTVTDDDGATDDVSHSVTVSATADPAPSIDACDPNNAGPGDQLTVAVVGSGFQPGASVSFGTRVTVQSVTFTDDAHLQVQIKVHPKAAGGPRDVNVTNPDGQSATKAGCFSVG